ASLLRYCLHFSLFFFTVPPPISFYSLSLHDALPISLRFLLSRRHFCFSQCDYTERLNLYAGVDIIKRKYDNVRAKLIKHLLIVRSEEHTLNSSHVSISYAVFCLKKKRIITNTKITK